MLLLFIAYLHLWGYAPASITSYICTIGYVHKLKTLPDPTGSFVVQRLLAAVSKVDARGDTRLPITLPILRDLILALRHTFNQPYLQSLLKAMLTVAFSGLMRLGEITSDSAEKAALLIGQISLQSDHAIIVIAKFKHNNSRQPFHIVLPRQTDYIICPFGALSQYLDQRGYDPGPLFCFPSLHPVSRNFFTAKLNTLLRYCGLNPGLYKSHSFRIGAASHYAAEGFSDEQIRLLGRWKSNAFRSYIRCQRVVNIIPQ